MSTSWYGSYVLSPQETEKLKLIYCQSNLVLLNHDPRLSSCCIATMHHSRKVCSLLAHWDYVTHQSWLGTRDGEATLKIQFQPTHNLL